MNQIISEVTAVSSKGQIVLPKKIRDQLQITAGSKMIVISDNENIIIKPIRTPDISEFSELMDAAAFWTEKAFNPKENIDGAVSLIRRHRKLGAAKGKFNCPMTLEEFDKDNEKIADMLLEGDL